MISPNEKYATSPSALRQLPMLLAAACMLAAAFSAPAFADDRNRNSPPRERMSKGGNEHRDQRGNRDRRHFRPDYRAPYSYAQPVYVPPPVYYEPQRSPGISLFFPLDLR